MSLPKQIQKQVTAAQKIIDEFDKSVQDPASTAAEAQLATTTDTNTADLGTDSSAQTTQQASHQPVVEDENNPTYKQRWQSLDGQLRAAAARENQSNARIQQLEQLVTTMQAIPAQAAPVQASATALAEDKEAYGEDLVNFVGRTTKATVEAENAALKQTVAELSAAMRAMQSTLPRVVQDQQLTADERFFSQLSGSVSDWNAVNNNQAFHSWLLEVDPMTGIARQTYLSEAQKERNVSRVANIFNTWKSLNGNNQTQQQGKDVTKTTRTELERQVAPSRSLATIAPNSDGKQIWTRALINQYYADVRNGLYRTRDSERISLERDIFAAQKEGRYSAA